MKNLNLVKKILAAFVSPLFFSMIFSCDVGLGESVDVEEPKVAITYPPASSEIRDYFIVAGTCSDDKEVRKVTINITNSDTRKDYGTYEAKLDDGKRWTCEFNHTETTDSGEKYPFPDGNYVLKVVATDGTGRTSGAASESIYIDNTSPVFVLTAPGSVTIDSCTTFGSILKVSGSVAEDKKVNFVTLTVYDKDKKQVASWTQDDINTSGTTNVTFAKYISNSSAAKDQLHANYVSIYDTDKGGDQSFYCTVKLGDSSGLWQTPVYESNGTILSDDRKEGYSGDAGNTTTTVWLNDDIYGQDANVGDLLSKNANPQFEIGDLKNLLNGTFSKADITEDQAKAAVNTLNQAKKDTSAADTYLAFKMNKDANPTYTLMGYGFTDLTKAGNNVASKAGTLTLKADAGLDGTTFTPATVKVYLFGPYTDEASASGTDVISSEIINKIFYDTENYAKDNALCQKLYDGASGVEGKSNSGPYVGVSTTSWTTSISLPDDIRSGSLYFVALTGNDKDEMDFLPQSYFGFKGKSSGQAPDVKITAPVSDSLANTLANLQVEGTVKSSDGSKIAAVSYEAEVLDVINGNKTLGILSGTTGTVLEAADGSITVKSGTLSADSDIAFAIDLTKAKWTPEEGVTADPRILNESQIYKYTVYVSGTDATGLSGKGSVVTSIDTKLPELAIASVSPVASSKTTTDAETGAEKTVYYVNGTIKVSGNITEQNLKDVELEITDGSAVSTYLLKTATYFNETLNTTGFADGEALKITLTAEDKAGNKAVLVNSDYIVDQSTDIPVISSEVSESVTQETVGVNNNLFGTTSNNKFAATITDDDGLNKIIYTLYQSDGTTVVETDTINAGGKTSYNLSKTLPKKEGKYVISVYVEDIYANEDGISDDVKALRTKSVKYNIGIDAGVPSLQFSTTNKGMIAANTEKTVKGTASDSSGLKSLIRYGVTLSEESIEKNKTLEIKITTADDNNCVTGAVEAQWIDGGDANTLTYDKTTGVWSDKIAATGETGVGNAPGRRRYIATDIYGNETILDFIYEVDAEAPAVYEIVSPSKSNFVFDGNNILSVKGKARDNRMEFSTVLFNIGTSEPVKTASPIDSTKYVYDTTQGTWESAVIASTKNSDPYQSRNFTANIDLRDETYTDGNYNVYIAVFDEANNQSYVVDEVVNNEVPNSDRTVISLVSDKTAPTLSFYTDSATKLIKEYNNEAVTLYGTFVEKNIKSLKLSGKVAGNNGSVTIPPTDVSPITAAKDSEGKVIPDTYNAEHIFGNDEKTFDGKYTLTITAIDMADHSVSQDVTFTVDKNQPTVKADPTTTYTNESWRNSTTQTIQVLAGDTGEDGTKYTSGIDSVKYYLDRDTTGVEIAAGSARDAKGTETGTKAYNIYKSTFNADKDGAHTIYVEVIDKCGNSVKTDPSFTYNIDTQAPVFSGEPAPSVTGFNNDTLADFTVTVSGSDANGSAAVSGISEIYIMKGTTQVADLTGLSGSTVSAQVLEVSKSNISAGTNTFSVYIKDAAGNVSTAKNFTVDYDSVAPVLNISSITPVASVEGDVNYVNGTVTVKGTVNDTNTKSVKLTVTGGGVTKEYTESAAASSFTQTVDTTLFATGSDLVSLTFTLYAEDTAGNKTTYVESAKYTVNQATDKPKITSETKDSEKCSFDQIAKNNNLFGTTSNNKLTATITDDDGIASITAVIYEKDGTTVKDDSQTFNPENKTVYNLTLNLPSDEGKYVIKVTIKDIYAEKNADGTSATEAQKALRTNTTVYNVGVDAGNPTLIFKTTNNSMTAASTAKTVEGTASDSSGLKSLIRYAVSDSGTTGTEETKWISGGSGNTITFDGTTFKDEISADKIGTKDGKRRYVATDIYGNETTLDFVYSVDAEPPFIQEITYPSTPSVTTVFNGMNIFSVKIKAADNRKEFKDVKYYVGSTAPSTKASPIDSSKTIYDTSKGTWYTATPSSSKNADDNQSTTYTANVDLSAVADGDYSVYFALFDEAENQSYVDSDKIIKLRSDKTAPVVTVNTVSDYNTAAVTVSGTLVETNLDTFVITPKGKDSIDIKEKLSGTSWSYTFSENGSYSLTVTATDKAGYTDSKTLSFIIDAVVPTVKADPTTTYTDGSWRNSTTQTIQVLAGDTGSDGKSYSSGIDYVKYYLDSDTTGVEIAAGSARDANGTTTGTKAYNIYKSTFDIEDDGTHTVYVKIQDKAGNSAQTSKFDYKVDTKAPVFSGEPVLSATGFNKDTLADFTVTVSGSDANGSAAVSGISEIYIMKGTAQVADLTGLSGSTVSAQVLTVSKSNISDGTNTFSVYIKDAAGNTSSVKTFTVDYDSVAPVLNISSITPVASVEGDVNYVNGTVTVKGTVNDTNTKSVKLTVTGGGVTKEYTESAAASSFTQTVDTTLFATGSAQVPLTFTLYAEDTAGNKTTISETGYTADQTTDKPTIDSGDTSTEITLEQIALNKNLFGITSNNKLTATVTDDDGVDSVKITVKNSSGTVVAADVTSLQSGETEKANPYTYSAGNKGSYKFSYVLPQTEGKYIIEVIATDMYGVTNSWTYNVGIDAGNPNLQFTVTNNARVGANVAKTVTGTATDSSGVVSIYRYATTSNADTAAISGDPQAKWEKSGSANTITYDSSTGVWSDTIAATGDTGIGTKSGRRRYIVKDVYGNETQLDFIYGVDAEAPVIRGITTPADVAAENVYNGNNVYSVIGTVSDDFKEFDKVLYFVGTASNKPAEIASPIDAEKKIYNTASGTWETAVLSTTKNDDEYESTTFTCNVNLKSKDDGIYYIYIAAFDQALIQSYADSAYVVKLTADKTKPVITTGTLKETYTASDSLTDSTVTLSGTLTETNLESFTISYKVRGNSGSNSYGPIEITPSGTSWSYNLAGPGNFEEIKLSAVDKAGFTAEWSGKTLIDDKAPVMILDPTVSTYHDGKWHSSTSQSIQVLVGDKGDDNSVYSSGITSVKYYLDGDTTGVEMAPGSARDSDGKTTGTLAYNIYKSTFDLQNGTHSLTVKAFDQAGNETALSGSITYKVDDKAPGTPVFDKTSTEINKSAYDSASVTIKVTSSDENTIAKGGKSDISQISKITLKKGNTVITSTTFEPATDSLSAYALEIPKTYGTDSKSTIVTGTNTFTVYVEDVAGNVSDGTDYTVTADITLPQVTYSSHSQNATVNKTISLSGTCSDNDEVKKDSGILYVYKKDGTTKVQAGTFSHNGDGTWDYENLNTVTYDTDVYGTQNENGLRPVKFLVQFADKVGNLSSEETSLTLNIDQNSDRPVIKLTNINSTNPVIKSTSVYGTITDDDGDVKNLWVIEKDSYVSTKLPSADNDNGWTKATLKSGDWSVDTTEGPHSWYFYIIDKTDTAFYTTSTDSLSRPYIQTKDASSKSDNSSAITFTADETGPVITMYVSGGTETKSSGLWKAAGEVFGGTSKWLWIKMEVTEAVGMQMDDEKPADYALPSVTIAGKSQTVEFVSNPTVSSGVYTYLLKGIDLSGLGLSDGTVQISAKVYDASLQPGNGGVNFIYDNDAPEVQIISPTTAVSDAVTSAVTIKGLVTDNYSSVSKLEWAIPVKTDIDDYTTTTGNWTTVAATASWEITFSSGASDSSDSLLYYAVATNDAGTDYIYNVTSEGTENIFKVPLWFRVTDSVGNVAVRKTYYTDESKTKSEDLYVLADVDGGKPKAWISSPEANSTTSGSVTVYGGASDDISVASVKVAYSSDGINYTEATASGTNSWKYPVDTSGMSKLYVKVRAYDEEGQTRSWTTPVEVTIDSQTPTIKNLKVVQYGAGKSSGTAVTSRDYSAGMYLSNNSVAENGNWYLTGTISDNQQVKSVTATKMSSSTVTIIDLPSTILSEGTSASYTLNVLLDTSSSGQIYSILKATDDAGTYTEQTIKINIDSTNPSLYNTSNAQSTSVGDALRLKSLSKALGTGTKNSSVANSNGYFTFGDTVIEAESGLAYMAFYFERVGSSENRIYNPMISNTGNANKTVISSLTPVKTSAMTSGSMYINMDSLPVLYVTGLTRSSEDSLTLASLGTNKNVRKGGLIKIGGSYSRITNVTDAGIVSFEPGVSTDFTTAEIVYAQVVDHQLTESVDGSGNVVNDDGDEMIESVNQIGTSYLWTASLDSTTIPDGPVYICAAAIDNAGNVTTGKILTSVTNNRPRIAKVMLATDLNQSKTFEYRGSINPVTDINDGTASGKSFGEFSYYSALNKVTGEAQYNVTIDSSAFKVKNGLCILPEFTGGNGASIKYAYDIDNLAEKSSPEVTSTTLNSMSTVTELTSTGVGTNKYKVVNKASIDISSQISSWGGIVFDDTTLNANGAKLISLKFWDETPETTQGVDSQWALLGVPLTVMTTDTIAPEASVNPLYWNSEKDNSVYKDSNNVLQGHIELEKDLTSAEKTLCGDTSARTKPKVSGKIVVEGTAYDDSLLGSITVVFGTADSQDKRVYGYSEGTWSESSNEGDTDAIISFSVEDTDLSQDGHIVKWTAVVDSELITNAAGLDQVFKVVAKDAAENKSVYTTGQTGDTLTSYYKLDVVPYITQIWTGLSETKTNNPSMYARSATGEYVVRGSTSASSYTGTSSAGESITVYGWNFGSSPVLKLGSTALTTGTVAANTNENVKQGTYGIPLTVPDSTSDAVTVTVNSVQNLNNINDDNARGGAEEDTSSYAGYYNRQPNGDNNNTLTDDVKLDIWDFKNAVTPEGTSANYVHMKVGPYLSSDAARSGRIGFSFRNGAGYFNMPGYRHERGMKGGSYGTTISYDTDSTTTSNNGSFTFYVPQSYGYPKIHMWNQNTYNYTGSWGTTTMSGPTNGYYTYTVNTTDSPTALYVIFYSSSDSKTANITIANGYGSYLYTGGTSLSKVKNVSFTTGINWTSTGTLYSQTKLGQNFQGFTQNSFAWDSNGETYGAALCSDTSGNDRMSANFQFFSRSFGESESDTSLNFNYYNCENGRRIENTKNADGKYDENRVMSPSMSTYTTGSKTYIYMAYWDHLENRIIYRVGSVNGIGYDSANAIGLGLKDLLGLTDHHSNYNTSSDAGKIGYDTSSYARRNSTDSSYKGDTTYENTSGNAYLYVKVLDTFTSATSAQTSVATLSDGSAVIAWYDDQSSKLKAVKITNAQMISTSTYLKNLSVTPVTISSNGGAYVSMAVDADDTIHFAYESNSGANLYYAYASKDLSSVTEMLVDVCDDVGDNCTIDVARQNSSSPWVPVISYKSNFATKTRVAYPVTFTSNRPTAGSTSGGMYTGTWSVSTLPSSNKSIDDTISVGYNKSWSDGVCHDFAKVTETQDDYGYTQVYSICKSTVTSGNGTANPVVGYAVSTGSIEMAQKK